MTVVKAHEEARPAYFLIIVNRKHMSVVCVHTPFSLLHKHLQGNVIRKEMNKEWAQRESLHVLAQTKSNSGKISRSPWMAG